MKEVKVPETVCPRLDTSVPCTYPLCDCPISYVPADRSLAAIALEIQSARLLKETKKVLQKKHKGSK